MKKGNIFHRKGFKCWKNRIKYIDPLNCFNFQGHRITAMLKNDLPKMELSRAKYGAKSQLTIQVPPEPEKKIDHPDWMSLCWYHKSVSFMHNPCFFNTEKLS